MEATYPDLLPAMSSYLIFALGQLIGIILTPILTNVQVSCRCSGHSCPCFLTRRSLSRTTEQNRDPLGPLWNLCRHSDPCFLVPRQDEENSSRDDGSGGPAGCKGAQGCSGRGGRGRGKGNERWLTMDEPPSVQLGVGNGKA